MVGSSSTQSTQSTQATQATQGLVSLPPFGPRQSSDEGEGGGGLYTTHIWDIMG